MEPSASAAAAVVADACAVEAAMSSFAAPYVVVWSVGPSLQATQLTDGGG